MDEKKGSLPRKTWINDNSLGLAKFAMVPPHIFLDKRVGASQVMIFCLLCFHANARGFCYMSQERLAELAGYTLNGEPNRRYVSRVLRELERYGYLERLGQRGFNMTNAYRLVMPDEEQFFRVARNRMLSDEVYSDLRKKEGLPEAPQGQE